MAAKSFVEKNIIRTRWHLFYGQGPKNSEFAFLVIPLLAIKTFFLLKIFKLFIIGKGHAFRPLTVFNQGFSAAF